MLTLEQWLRSGQRQLVDLSARPRGLPERFPIFCRAPKTSAQGTTRPVLTMLHGFPTCSWDYARMMPLLEGHFWPLLFDFLGFGNSDKPRGYAYSIERQADITEAVWARHKVKRTWLLAHDYGASVALELLARKQRLALDVEILGVTFLNAGLYPELHRPLPLQRALRSKVLGPVLARLASESTLRRAFSQIISPAHPISALELRQHWQAISMRGGGRNAHELMHYIEDRERNVARWTQALESEVCSMQFVWGMLDPISGAPIIERLMTTKPAARLIRLEDVGHYPQIESPVAVADALIAFARG